VRTGRSAYPDWARIAGSALIVIALVLTASPPLARGVGPASKKTQLALFDSHISHIVFLMQENHAYDNLYGLYCQATGKYCRTVGNGIPTNTCVPKDPAHPSLGCIKPYNLTLTQVNQDLAHDWNSTHTAWNNGAMNGFLKAEGSSLAFGHYNASTVPLYYDLAEEYGLGDNMYSGAMSYSLSNHWYEVASLPPPLGETNYIGGGTSIDHQYLNQSNGTLSLENALLNSTVSWTYYDFPLPAQYNQSIGGSSHQPALAFDYWNPLAGRAYSYTAGVRSHFVGRTNFFTDAAAGSLPNVSWVIPSLPESDHPPEGVLPAQNWVASVVDALERSPEWNSTVLFVSWDEYGGFYDHVSPPGVDSVGDGFRVPLLAIGPWVKQGFIDHQNLSFSSILHLMEDRFHFSCLGPRDCNAALPLSMFDFNRTAPRAPIGFPVNGTASYPMPLQSSGHLPYFGPWSPFLPSYSRSSDPPPPNFS
jgi:phospholipase C